MKWLILLFFILITLNVNGARKSCMEILNHNESSGSGVYTIDLDGDDFGADPFDVYCDMETDGGGWTLVATLADDGNNYWTWNNRNNLSNGNEFGSLDTALTNDFQSKAWTDLVGNQVMAQKDSTKYVIYSGIIHNETLASKYTLGNDIVPQEYYIPSRIEGAWDYQCTPQLAMRLQSPDSDINGWNEGSKGFIWMSNNNNGCSWDDTLGGLSPATAPSEEYAWGSSYFYKQNFGGDSLKVFVRTFQECGNGLIEGSEECDDANTDSLDGCSSTCDVEKEWSCTKADFSLAYNEVFEGGHDSGPDWSISADGRTVSQTVNSEPSIYVSTLPVVDIPTIFTLEVKTTNDNDFIGWAIGYEANENESNDIDWILFDWKQGDQREYGGSEPARAGLNMWRVHSKIDGGNDAWNHAAMTKIASGINYGNVGWSDNTQYTVSMEYSVTNIKIRINGVLEFDIDGIFPRGYLSFYTYSQPNDEFTLTSPIEQSVCTEMDSDGDGLSNLWEDAHGLNKNNVDTDGDGIRDLEEVLDLDNPLDSDDDGIINALDDDDDGDGILTVDEDINNDLNPVNDDTDGDNIPNYLDTDDDGDGDLTIDDCGPLDDTIHTGVTEICDGIDQNCDGHIDEGNVCDSCETKFFNNHSYLFCETTKSWNDAKTSCEANGYTLVSIETNDENSWIFTTMNNVFNSQDAWVGYTDAADENVWVWENNSLGIFTNWKANEPSNNNNNENCVEIQHALGEWNDLNCTANRRYICEVGENFTECMDLDDGTYNGDADNDGICAVSDNCKNLSNVSQEDIDGDDIGDICDNDIDGDNVNNEDDLSPTNPNICRDLDNDGCDDCSNGHDDVSNDGLDSDNDGICDNGDNDDDNDGVNDNSDSDPTNPNVCSDIDNDGCDDCLNGSFDTNNDGIDSDGDGLCDNGDNDDDNDGINDYDEDGSPLDNCINIYNPDQSDIDLDGIGDFCDDDIDGDSVDNDNDNCVYIPNGVNEDNQADSDNDGIGDVCDDSNGVVDTDGDGINDKDESGRKLDNCVNTPNPDQLDSDNDGYGDVCDNDVDGDRVKNEDDNCIFIANSDQFDSDNDGIGDECDDDDSSNIDSDNDGEPDVSDNCKLVPNADQLDTDGDGFGDLCDSDDDNDGIEDSDDNCSTHVGLGTDQTDTDNDGYGDICDEDDDNDNVNDVDDSVTTNPNVCRDLDNDGCDDCSSGHDDVSDDGLDSDSDGICNTGDNDDDNDGITDEDDNCPLVVNPDQLDSDDNGIGDACEHDNDGDGIDDIDDNCPLISNPEQVDTDDDKAGDACDEDDDNDGVNDNDDNCPLIANSNQVNSDDDEFGDACDDDDDNDGVKDSDDNCIVIANPDQENHDDDDLGSYCDDDDDNDGVKDVDDNCPLIANADQLDSDNDGIGDICEKSKNATNPEMLNYRGSSMIGCDYGSSNNGASLLMLFILIILTIKKLKKNNL